MRKIDGIQRLFFIIFLETSEANELYYKGTELFTIFLKVTEKKDSFPRIGKK